jgi:hypothetical protein
MKTYDAYIYFDESLFVVYYTSVDGNDLGSGYEGTGKWSIVFIIYGPTPEMQTIVFVQGVNEENYVNFIAPDPDYGTGSVIIRGIRQEVIP